MKKLSLLSRSIGKALLKAKPFLDSANTNSVLPFESESIIRPRLNERYYSWTHYGIFIPNLPEPHRYLNIMIFLGTPSALAFDHDHLISQKKSPRHTATFFSSTAATQGSLLKAYDFDDECEISESGDIIQLGSDVKISGKLPHIRLEGKYLGLEFNFELDVSHHVSWFLKNPVYDHLSLLSKIKGTLTDEKQTFQINDLCTYEYARSVGLHSVYDSIVPTQHKIPLDFFTYQIINIDSYTQILLTKADILGEPAAYTAHIRYLDHPAEVYTDVEFKVLNYFSEPKISPYGEAMHTPESFEWTVRDNGETILQIQAYCDAPYQYGHGRGYATSYRYTGTLKANAIQGFGYMEYVDLK